MSSLGQSFHSPQTFQEITLIESFLLAHTPHASSHWILPTTCSETVLHSLWLCSLQHALLGMPRMQGPGHSNPGYLGSESLGKGRIWNQLSLCPMLYHFFICYPTGAEQHVTLCTGTCTPIYPSAPFSLPKHWGFWTPQTLTPLLFPFLGSKWLHTRVVGSGIRDSYFRVIPDPFLVLPICGFQHQGQWQPSLCLHLTLLSLWVQDNTKHILDHRSVSHWLSRIKASSRIL